MEKFITLFENDKYSMFMSAIAFLLLIWGIYNRIKFLCLEKAAEKVAEAEERSDLSGEEKFALCVLWINESLPTVFRNSVFRAMIEKLINIAYNCAFSYMKKYVKRKTGYDIGDIIEKMKDSDENDMVLLENNDK